MRPLNSIELLQLWEDGLGLPLLENSLRLLNKACNAEEISQIARLSIGERDALLFQLRAWMFGPDIKNMVNCPQCNEVVEWETPVASLQLQRLPETFAVRTFTVVKDQYTVHFRLPDSNDLLSFLNAEKNDQSAAALLNACILGIKDPGGEAASPDKLPAVVREAISQQMEREDPQADIRMQINCPQCASISEARFDIMSFLWEEISHWAKRIMQEIVFLSRHLGWSETDILRMSPRRRRLYIEMVRG